MSEFWREAVMWMAIGAAATPIVLYLAHGDLTFAILLGPPIGGFAALVTHWWVWRTGPPR